MRYFCDFCGKISHMCVAIFFIDCASVIDCEGTTAAAAELLIKQLNVKHMYGFVPDVCWGH